MGEKSDVDLAIVDARYYERIDHEVIRWEERNRADKVKGLHLRGLPGPPRRPLLPTAAFEDLPEHLFSPSLRRDEDVVLMEHCGRRREMNAFIFRDWWALRGALNSI